MLYYVSKGQYHEIFKVGFHKIASPGPLKEALELFVVMHACTDTRLVVLHVPVFMCVLPVHRGQIS